MTNSSAILTVYFLKKDKIKFSIKIVCILTDKSVSCSLKNAMDYFVFNYFFNVKYIL